jgi:hypothetical protein
MNFEFIRLFLGIQRLSTPFFFVDASISTALLLAAGGARAA